MRSISVPAKLQKIIQLVEQNTLEKTDWLLQLKNRLEIERPYEFDCNWGSF